MKAAFFDAGGTLVHVDFDRVARIVADVTGRPLDPKRLRQAEGAGAAAVDEALKNGMAPTDASRWQLQFKVMLAEVGVSAAEFARVGPLVIAEHKRSNLWSSVVPGRGEALGELRAAGWFVACISNADGTVERLLERVGLLEHLEFVVDSGKVGIEKPDPRIFQIALERSGMNAADSYYVGDIYGVDVVGARAAGLVPVLLDRWGRHQGVDCRLARDVPAFCRELVSASAAA